MTRIEAALTREDVDLAPRSVSASAKARIIKRDGQCTYPECDVSTGLEVDHIIALALGGRNDDRNLAALCADHHLAKTKRDVKLIAKAKRLNLTHNGQKPPPTRKLNGPGFRKRWGELSHD